MCLLRSRNDINKFILFDFCKFYDLIENKLKNLGIPNTSLFTYN